MFLQLIGEERRADSGYSQQVVKKGLQFTVAVCGWFSSFFLTFVEEGDTCIDEECMYVGQSGTGRTTFVNTLCESEVLAHKETANADRAHEEDGIRIKPVNVGMLSFLCFGIRGNLGEKLIIVVLAVVQNWRKKELGFL